MSRTTDRRVPVTVRARQAESVEAAEDLVEAALDRPPLLGEPVVDAPISVLKARNAVLAQLGVGAVSGLAAVAFAVVLAGFPMAATPGIFFEPSPGELLPTLPLLMVALLWALAATGALVPAVRVGRLTRWARADADAIPVHPLLARLGGLGLYALVLLSIVVLPIAWWVFG